MVGNSSPARSQTKPLLSPAPNWMLSYLLTCPISPLCWDLLCQGEGACGSEAAGIKQVTEGTTGAAVHPVSAARSLRRGGPDSIFAPSSPSPPHHPKPIPGVWGSIPRSHQA